MYKRDGKWFYFCGIQPVFFHAEKDHRSFRMFTAQLVCQGICKQAEIIRTFGVSKNSVGRSVKKYQEGGADAFFAPRKGRGASVVTEEKKVRAQELFYEGHSKREVAKELEIPYDTLRKAVQQGRLPFPEICAECTTASDGSRRSGEARAASDKSTRSSEDASAEMGVGCTRPAERVLAALGVLQGAPTRFEPCRDVSCGGVLCVLPALIASGLLRHVDACFKTLSGYYSTLHILLVVAYMALCRIRTAEQLQYEPPGELGKLLGLDRVPEVRCLRAKLAALSEQGAAEKWQGLLSRDWMQGSPELAGALYVDGHVRVYHGGKTKLPKRFVSRQRLCLRATTDYWVNDALGQPYFVVDRPVDAGLLEALRNNVVPRLLRDVPAQPSDAELEADPHRHRFIMVFDREGYSPSFFKEMWNEHRIACITYHKFPREKWSPEEFAETEVTMPTGERLRMKLAERGSWVGDKKHGLWMREVRKLNESGHQTSLLSTVKSAFAVQDAALLFSRWSQENFFAYMMKHYAIDLLSEYGTEGFPGNQRVVNPVWRELDRMRRSLQSKLTHRRARYGALELHPQPKDKEMARWEQEKVALVEQIESIEHEFEQTKAQLAEIPKHIDWQDLPEDAKFERLCSSRKKLVDTIKMIAYRAETAMAHIVREAMARPEDARALIRNLCLSEADILPDLHAGTLTVRVHSMANPRTNRSIEHLLNHLNDAEFNYPGTTLRLSYVLASPLNKPTHREMDPPQIPTNQES